MKNSFLVAGVDLGGTNARISVVSECTSNRENIALPSLGDCYKEMDCIIKCIESLLPEAIKILDVIVFACAPTVAKDGSVIRWPNRSYWRGFNIKKILQQRFNCDVVFIDDGNAAAFAESNLRKESELVYIGIGTGVAGGIVLNGEIYCGKNGKAAEIGHTILFPDGNNCTCGRKGCLQAYVSGPSILQQASCNYADEFIAKANNKSPLLINILSKISFALAITVINVSELLDVSLFVFGGGVVEGNPEIIESTRENVNKLLREGQQNIRLEITILSNDAPLEGALLLAKHCIPFNEKLKGYSRVN